MFAAVSSGRFPGRRRSRLSHNDGVKNEKGKQPTGRYPAFTDHGAAVRSQSGKDLSSHAGCSTRASGRRVPWFRINNNNSGKESVYDRQDKSSCVRNIRPGIEEL